MCEEGPVTLDQVADSERKTGKRALLLASKQKWSQVDDQPMPSMRGDGKAGSYKQDSVQQWLMSSCQELVKAEPDLDATEPLKRQTSGEDDLVLGVEASVYGKSPQLQSAQQPLWSQPAGPQLTPWNSQTSTFSAQSGTLSVMDVLNLWHDDPEELLLELGFGSEEPDISVRIPARFISHQSRARGINLQVFLEAQKNRMDLENPDVSNRFRQLEVLQQVTSAFSSLVPGPAPALPPPTASANLSPAAQERRRRLGQLFRRVSKKSLSVNQSQSTPPTSLPANQEPASPDRRPARKHSRPGPPEGTGLTPLVEEQSPDTSRDTCDPPAATLAPQGDSPRSRLGRDPPCRSPIRRKSPGDMKTLESFEIEEIHSFDEGSVGRSGPEIGEAAEAKFIRTNSCQSDSSGFLEEPFIPGLSAQASPVPELMKALHNLSGDSTDSQFTIKDNADFPNDTDTVKESADIPHSMDSQAVKSNTDIPNGMDNQTTVTEMADIPNNMDNQTTPQKVADIPYGMDTQTTVKSNADIPLCMDSETTVNPFSMDGQRTITDIADIPDSMDNQTAVKDNADIPCSIDNQKTVQEITDFPYSMDNQTTVIDIADIPCLMDGQMTVIEIADIPTSMDNQTTVQEVADIPNSMDKQTTVQEVADIPNSMDNQTTVQEIADIPYSMDSQTTAKNNTDIPYNMDGQTNITEIAAIPYGMDGQTTVTDIGDILYSIDNQTTVTKIADISDCMDSQTTVNESTDLPSNTNSCLITQKEYADIPCGIDSQMTVNERADISYESDTVKNYADLPNSMDNQITVKECVYIPYNVNRRMSGKEGAGFPCSIDSQMTINGNANIPFDTNAVKDCVDIPHNMGCQINFKEKNDIPYSMERQMTVKYNADIPHGKDSQARVLEITDFPCNPDSLFTQTEYADIPHGLDSQMNVNESVDIAYDKDTVKELVDIPSSMNSQRTVKEHADMPCSVERQMTFEETVDISHSMDNQMTVSESADISCDTDTVKGHLHIPPSTDSQMTVKYNADIPHDKGSQTRVLQITDFPCDTDCPTTQKEYADIPSDKKISVSVSEFGDISYNPGRVISAKAYRDIPYTFRLINVNDSVDIPNEIGGQTTINRCADISYSIDSPITAKNIPKGMDHQTTLKGNFGISNSTGSQILLEDSDRVENQIHVNKKSNLPNSADSQRIEKENVENPPHRTKSGVTLKEASESPYVTDIQSSLKENSPCRTGCDVILNEGSNLPCSSSYGHKGAAEFQQTAGQECDWNVDREEVRISQNPLVRIGIGSDPGQICDDSKELCAARTGFGKMETGHREEASRSQGEPEALVCSKCKNSFQPQDSTATQSTGSERGRGSWRESTDFPHQEDGEGAELLRPDWTSFGSSKSVSVQMPSSLPSVSQTTHRRCPAPPLDLQRELAEAVAATSSSRGQGRRPSRGRLRKRSASLDTGLAREEREEEEEEVGRWEGGTIAGGCGVCDHRCTCCSCPTHHMVGDLNSAALQRLHQTAFHSSPFTFSLAELEGMMRAMRRFRCVLEDMEQRLQEEGAQVYPDLSHPDREDMVSLQELRTEVKKEAELLETQLAELANHCETGITTRMQRLLDEQSQLCMQLRIPSEPPPWGPAYCHQAPPTGAAPLLPSPVIGPSVATQCCLLPDLLVSGASITGDLPETQCPSMPPEGNVTPAHEARQRIPPDKQDLLAFVGFFKA